MIVQNAVMCVTCGDYIFSAHRFDYNECTCGAIAVDGGQEYLRRVGAMDSCVDMSWSLPDEVYNECAKVVQEAIDTNRNRFGIANAVMRILRNYNHIIAEGEQRVIAKNENSNEVLIVEEDGSYARYRKVNINE